MSWEMELALGWAAQAGAALVYGYSILSKGGGGARLARWLLGAAWLALGAWLAQSWRASGLWQPPWLRGPELLVFGAWCVSGVQLVADSALGAGAAGVFSATMAMAASGIVVFAWKAAAPSAASVAAGLQNPWIWIHGPSAMAGFSLLFVSAMLSALALARSTGGADSLMTALAALSLATLAARALDAPAREGAVVGFATYLLLGLFLVWLERHDRRVLAAISGAHPEVAARAAPPPNRQGFRKIARAVFACGWGAFSASFREFEPGADSVRWLWALLLVLVGLAALMAAYRPKRIEKRLPATEELDHASHQAALYAFPFLTLHLVSGSLWAYDAWGSYWSWQPQQGWVFVAWLYLALILHLARDRARTWIATFGSVIWILAALRAAAAHGVWPLPS